PVIDSVIHIVTDEQETQTLGIKYTPTPIRNVVFDRYRFQLSGTNIPAQEKLQNDTNRLVIFDDLIPGRLYNISIWTVSGGVYSVPIDRQARLLPGKVNNFVAVHVKPNVITLQWTLPSSEQNGILTGFVITYFVKVFIGLFNLYFNDIPNYSLTNINRYGSPINI
ncbi:tyrosine-protein phosphatase 10D, partial [Trichonephila inaurata madagascariensis]